MKKHSRIWMLLLVFFTVSGIGYIVIMLPYTKALPTQPTREITVHNKAGNASYLNPETVMGENVNIGLMNREKVNDDGMLFVFPTNKEQSFTMYNTEVPLHALWLDNNFTIVDSQLMLPCPSWKLIFCPTYSSAQEVRYVLELPVNQKTSLILDGNYPIDTLQ